MEPIRSPFSDSLATGHWYNSDGSLSDIYRERLLKRGRSIAEIEELDETARREFQIRQEWLESLAAHRKRYGGRGDKPQQALIDRAIALSTQPPWSLVSEGYLELDEAE